jgi:UDP-2,3-diacylglucosamine hydrolase
VRTRILFISDLHLEPARPDITRSLLQFLADNAGRCDALYVLGDLFEVWIGDDEESALADEVASAFRAFAAAGSAVFLLHGNRDFLIGTDYAARCSASLINEPWRLPLGASEVLLLHGDTLCTDDVDYLAFRQQVRDPAWQQAFLARPLSERQAFARQAREQSRVATAGKAMTIMDVNPAAVEAALLGSELKTLLHGHTHRPAVHEVPLPRAIAGSHSGQRIVLGSWDESGWYAESDGTTIHLHQFPLQA